LRGKVFYPTFVFKLKKRENMKATSEELKRTKQRLDSKIALTKREAILLKKINIILKNETVN